MRDCRTAGAEVHILPILDCQRLRLFVRRAGAGPFRRFVGVKVGVSLAFAATPCKWATSGFSVKHLALAFYGPV